MQTVWDSDNIKLYALDDGTCELWVTRKEIDKLKACKFLQGNTIFVADVTNDRMLKVQSAMQQVGAVVKYVGKNKSKNRLCMNYVSLSMLMNNNLFTAKQMFMTKITKEELKGIQTILGIEKISGKSMVSQKATELKEFAGKSFCITGALTYFSNRQEAIRYIEARGGRFDKMVDYDTDYLITNTPNSGSRKNKLAREYGTRLITEGDLIEIGGLPR